MNLSANNVPFDNSLIIIIIMVIFKCCFSGEHIALSINKNNNGVNIAFGKTNRFCFLWHKENANQYVNKYFKG